MTIQYLTASDPEAEELAKAFGLSTNGLVSFRFEVKAGHIAVLSAEYYVDIDKVQGSTIPTLLKRYRLEKL